MYAQAEQAAAPPAEAPVTADTSTTLLRRAHELLLRVVNLETHHAPATGLHTIAPRLYQAKAALVAVEQALKFPSSEEANKSV